MAQAREKKLFNSFLKKKTQIAGPHGALMLNSRDFSKLSEINSAFTTMLNRLNVRQTAAELDATIQNKPELRDSLIFVIRSLASEQPSSLKLTEILPRHYRTQYSKSIAAKVSETEKLMEAERRIKLEKVVKSLQLTNVEIHDVWDRSLGVSDFDMSHFSDLFSKVRTDEENTLLRRQFIEKIANLRYISEDLLGFPFYKYSLGGGPNPQRTLPITFTGGISSIWDELAELL